MEYVKNLSERRTDIDVMRGLCMLCVMLGHSLPMNFLNITILSFHMMAFYFISGLCFRSSNAPLSVSVKRKITNLGWVLVTFSIAGIIINYCFLAMGKGQDVPLWKAIIGIFYSDGIIGKGVTKGFWFVRELLYISVLYIVLEKYIGKYFTLFVWAIIALLLSVVFKEFYMSQTLCRTAWGGCFYSLGSVMANYNNRIDKISRVVCLMVGFVFLFLTAFFAQQNTPVLIYRFEYGNIGIFVTTALLGSFSLYYVSKFIRYNMALEYVGRNSISYLFVHFSILEILRFIAQRFGTSNYLYHIMLFVITVIISTLFCMCINKYLPWMTKLPALKQSKV